MCGFAGVFSKSSPRENDLVARVGQMAATLVHRGPDDSGTWVDAEAGVAFGFRRLAIIDLSELGHQPMHSVTHRFTIMFNGEVYNFAELRAELLRSGCTFRGHSDTEVILAAFERWGVQAATQRFIGMFAIALWDREKRTLSLIRDRLGIKPLFVSGHRGEILFGSELKAIVADKSFDRELDQDSLTAYLRYLYVPAPRTIYRHAVKLLPGHILTITDPARPLPQAEQYWSVEEIAQRGLANPIQGSDQEVIAEGERLLADAVRTRMIADVPLGALLSGGIDSSVVVALMQRASSRPVKTYSVAFREKEYNEAPHAKKIAEYLGTDHTEVTLTGDAALAVVPQLAGIFDEPHADTSQIPAYLICGVARKEVTVALTGDGADEVWGGYNRYSYGERMLERMLRVPRPARRLVAAGIGTMSSDSWDRAYEAITPVLPARLRQRMPGDKLHKFGRLMGSDSAALMYRSLVSGWQHPEHLVPGGREQTTAVDRVLQGNAPSRLLDKMMLADQLTYLPDDQLAKVDRVSMAVSLEVRVPLIDHRLVEFSWQLPASMKVRNGRGKWLLREVLYRHVPKELIERPKQGLSVPIDQWLRGPLRAWAEALLDEGRILREETLDAGAIRRAWRELLGGRGEGALGLWAVLMFQAWRERWIT